MSIHGHLRACSVASPDFFSPFFHACWCSPLGVSGENTLLPAPTPLLCSCQLRDAQKMSVCLLPGHSWQLSSSSGTCAAATGAGEEREVSWGGGEYSDAVFLGNGWCFCFCHLFFLLQRRATEGVSTLPPILWSPWLLRFSAQHSKMRILQPAVQIHLVKNCRLIFFGGGTSAFVKVTVHVWNEVYVFLRVGFWGLVSFRQVLCIVPVVLCHLRV